MTNLIKTKTPMFLGLMVVFVYVSHFFILGEKTYLVIHDSLDSVYIYLKMLADNNLFFSSSFQKVDSFGTGMLRGNFPTEFTFVSMLFNWMPAFWAYAFNAVLVHLIAYFSMNKFLKHFFREDNELIKLVISCCFAILPYWYFGGASIALIPFGFVIYDRILNEGKKDKKAWILLILIPLYSSFFLCWMLVIGIRFLFAVYEYFKGRKINYLVLALVIQTLIYCAIEYRLIEMMFYKGFVSHRVEFNFLGDDFSNVIRNFWKLLLYGHYHSHSIHWGVIAPFFILTTITSVVMGYKSRYRLLACIGLLILLTAGISSLYHWNVFQSVLKFFFIFRVVNFERFFFFLPLLWMMAFYLSAVFWIERKNGKWFVILVFCLQVIFSFYKSDYWTNYSGPRISYENFYSERQFADIANQTNSPKAFWGGIGVHPAVLQFNGFKTFDFYHYNYDLSYKHKFYEYIKDELELDLELRDYFLNWGSRAYFFSHKIGKKFLGKNKGRCSFKKPISPKFNFRKMKEDGLRYMFSLCKIADAAVLIDYSKSKFYWKGYVYDIDSLIQN